MNCALRRSVAASIFLPLLLLLVMSSAGCGPNPASGAPESPGAPSAATPVRVTTAALVTWPETVRVQGSLVEDERATVGAKVPGRVKTVKVDRGSAVKQGDVLAELEPEDFELQVRLAEAQVNQVRAKIGLKPDVPDEKLDRLKSPPVAQERALLDEARVDVDRIRNLVRRNAASAEDLERVEAALRVAEARYQSALNTVEEQVALLATRRVELDQAKQRRTDSVIRAPFDGIVQDRKAATGDSLQIGQPVVTLVRTRPLRFHGGVPERVAAQVQIDKEIRVWVEKVPQPIPTRVKRISPALDMANRSLMIEADIANARGELRAGLFAEADIVVDPDAKALAVPESAVMEFAGVEKAWVVRDGRAEARRVHTGRRDKGLVEILGGLSPGDTVLTDAAQGRAGPVTVAKDP